MTQETFDFYKNPDYYQLLKQQEKREIALLAPMFSDEFFRILEWQENEIKNPSHPIYSYQQSLL